MPFRSARVAVIACLAAALAAPAAAPAAAAPASPARTTPARVGDVVPGSYIVTLAAGASIERVTARNFIAPQALTSRFSSVFLGFTATMTSQTATLLADDPRVESVEPNRWLEITGTQSAPPWGLDRIDERDLPLSGSYAYETTGADVDAYILDTGVRASHGDFGARVAAGFDATGWGSTDDCNGHGTHVAGTVAGATSGVAKGVRIVPVRAMYCDGSGTAEDVLEALEWITQDHDAGDPAVANMSVASNQPITAVDTAVRAAVTDGVTVVVAAGNEAVDACYVSPANVVEALTVGASDRYDARATFSNYGACLDIFAPGVDIWSTGHASDTSFVTMSGTSMAAPHVTGAAARYLQSDPAASPAQVALVLTSEATPDAVSGAGANSPTNLLYAAPPSSSSSWTASTTPSSTLTMAPSVTTLVYGNSTTLNGWLTSGGSGVAFETVRVERRRVGTTTWRLLTRKKTDRYGRVAVTTSPSSSNDYRMRYLGDAYTASKSAADRVGVRTRVTTALSDGTVKRGDVAKISGAVRPAHDGRSVVLQRYRDGAWRKLRSKALNTDSRYTFRLPTSSRGTFRFRVIKPGDVDHLRGFGKPRRLTVE